MLKLPRVSGIEGQRDLERLGFQKVRQSGGCVIIKRESKGCVVPMHGKIKIGTLAGAIRQNDILPEEFIQALRR